MTTSKNRARGKPLKVPWLPLQPEEEPLGKPEQVRGSAMPRAADLLDRHPRIQRPSDLRQPFQPLEPSGR